MACIFEEWMHLETIAELNEKFQGLLSHYECHEFSLAILTKDMKKMKEDFSILEAYPTLWRDHYIAHHYFEIDPVFHTQTFQQQPLSWHIETFEGLSPIQKKMLHEAHDFGVEKGTTFPLPPSPTGACYLTILNRHLKDPHLIYLFLKASSLYLNLKHSLEKKEKIQNLTKREREVLSYKSQGYPIKQVASLMDTKESTVVFHLKNIRQKLKAHTTEQALFIYGYANGD